MIIDLRNCDDQHLGFVLFAQADESSGDCIGRALPKKAELFETAEYEYLGELQDEGEFHWKLDRRNARLTIGRETPVLDFRIHDGDKCVDEATELGIFGILVETRKPEPPSPADG
jgi:hypothetical protein